MLEVDIPGYGGLQLRHLVMDYNGTMACDGRLIPGVEKRLVRLSETLTLHVVTADTHGCAHQFLKDLPCRLTVLPIGDQAQAKSDYVRELGARATAAIGNGRNDRLMLRDAVLGIGVILDEGAFGGIFLEADMIFTSIDDALDLLLHPLRLMAGLRS